MATLNGTKAVLVVLLAVAPAVVPPADAQSPVPAQATQPNLTLQKFPAEFADYYTTQRLVARPAEAQPFCKSAVPLLCNSDGNLPLKAILDESGGTGTGYDTLYIDPSGDGEFINPVAYKVSPVERKTGLGGRPLVGYFDSVGIPRGQADEAAPRAQVFVEHDPTGAAGTDYVVNLIPAQWAVGTVQMGGQAVPVAMVDGTWSGNVADRGGADPERINQMAPGDDARAMRGDYIILGKPGQTSLEPGDPNSWLGQSGSARALNTRYLVLDSGIYETQAEPVEGGVNLHLVPASVPTTTVDLSQVPHAGRFAMFGANTSVVLDNAGGAIQVPADTYYVPAFGAYTADVPEGGNVSLPRPADLEASGAQTYTPLPDREQRLFAAEPPGGVVDWSQPQSNPFAFATGRSWRNMELQVISAETGRPIAKAKVSADCYVGRWPAGGWGTRECTTDSSGRCTIRLPGGNLEYVGIEVVAPGFVAARKRWSLRYGEDLPPRYTWPAEGGVTIGGTVRDERDRPIRGVQVRIIAQGPPAAADMPEPASWLADVRTDRQGKWKCDGVSARAFPLRIRLRHPDYLSDEDAVRTAPVEQLRDLSAVFVMKKGIALDGKVLGPKGTPVKDANLYIGRQWSNKSAKTGRDGRFQIRNLQAGDIDILVMAPGCAPDVMKVTAEENMRPVEFTLEAARTLKGRVVDENSSPIPGAQINLQYWHGGFYLYWHARTDPLGRFRWDEAPVETLAITIDAEGRGSAYEYLLAGPDEHVIVLTKRTKITGRVVDAATGQAIPSFKAFLGVEYGDDRTWWQRYEAVTGKNGAFTMEGPGDANCCVRVEAEGYLPAVSAVLEPAPSQTAELAMTRGEGLSGAVLGPDDQPLCEAQVAVAPESEPLRISDGRVNRDFGAIATMTDRDGRFSLPPQIDVYTLVATHERGFGLVAQAAFEKSHRIRLEPWGRIEGTARRFGQALRGQRLWFSRRQNMGSKDFPFSFYYEASTDDAGRFTIERMIPGIHSIEWSQERDSRYRLQCRRTIEVTPGQVCRLDFEEAGQRVKGRLHATVTPGRKIIRENPNAWILRLRPWPKPPASLPAGPHALQAWYDGWLRSDKGREYRLAERRYSFLSGEDGTFETPRLPPGRYMLSADLMEQAEGEKYPTMAGMIVHGFEVRLGDDLADVPLDLGTLPLKRVGQVKAGQPAPPFTCKTLDGERISLSQFHGKYVLLGFWASWQDQDYGINRFKSIRKMYGQDDRLVIVSLSLDSRVEDARNAALIHGMTWMQGHLGEWGHTSVPGDYGVTWLPSDVLIGPDGRILGGIVVGLDPRAELIKALGKPAASTQPSAATKAAPATQAGNAR